MRLKMGNKFADITISEIEAFLERPEQFGKTLTLQRYLAIFGKFAYTPSPM